MNCIINIIVIAIVIIIVVGNTMGNSIIASVSIIIGKFNDRRRNIILKCSTNVVLYVIFSSPSSQFQIMLPNPFHINRPKSSSLLVNSSRRIGVSLHTFPFFLLLSSLHHWLSLTTCMVQCSNLRFLVH